LVGDEPALRSSLPLGVDVSDPAQIQADVVATAEALVERLRTVTAAQVADLLAARVVPGNRAGPISPLRQAEDASRLDASTVLELRPHLRHAMRYDEEHVVLTLPDRQLVLPLATGKAVRALLDGARLRVSGLPGLDPDDALVLARRLVREAVVVVVDRQ
jgi:hypothetical protein